MAFLAPPASDPRSCPIRRKLGGASRLFSAFVAEHDPESVKSFSDNRYFTGGMYQKLGFVKEADIELDYQVYHPKTGLLPN